MEAQKVQKLGREVNGASRSKGTIPGNLSHM